MSFFYTEEYRIFVIKNAQNWYHTDHLPSFAGQRLRYILNYSVCCKALQESQILGPRENWFPRQSFGSNFIVEICKADYATGIAKCSTSFSLLPIVHPNMKSLIADIYENKVCCALAFILLNGRRGNWTQYETVYRYNSPYTLHMICGANFSWPAEKQIDL